jgi:hypothetical protein
LLDVLAPLHALGIAHGSVGESVVLEEHGPTLLVAGRSPTAIAVEAERRSLSERLG